MDSTWVWYLQRVASSSRCQHQEQNHRLRRVTNIQSWPTSFSHQHQRQLWTSIKKATSQQRQAHLGPTASRPSRSILASTTKMKHQVHITSLISLHIIGEAIEAAHHCHIWWHSPAYRMTSKRGMVMPHVQTYQCLILSSTSLLRATHLSHPNFPVWVESFWVTSEKGVVQTIYDL